MRTALRFAGIVLLVLGMSCANHTQRAQNTQQGNEAQPQPSPHATKSSGERGTPAEAKAMLEAAVAHYQEVGRKQALADFNGRKAPFFDRDLYVVCVGPNGIISANGAFPSYVGASANVLKDADGKPLGNAILNIGNGTGEGSMKYRMINPVSGKFEPKITFGQKVGEDVCGVGAYNP